MREPSIHITQNQLIKLIEEWNRGVESSKPVPAGSLAKYLLERGSNFNLSHRIILANTKKNQKKAFSLKSSPTEDAHLFSNLIYLTRKKLHHRGIKQHKESSKEWGSIKEGASLGIEFCRSFDLSKEQGFKVFIEEVIDIGDGKFDLRRMSSRFELACDNYYAKNQIAKDTNSELTEEVFIYYQQKIYEKCGHNFDYKTQPNKYVHFIDAGNIAKSLGLTAQQYVEAHFDSISWANGVPHVSQLSSKSSIERVLRWMIENNIKGQESHDDISGDQLKHILKYGIN